MFKQTHGNKFNASLFILYLKENTFLFFSGNQNVWFSKQGGRRLRGCMLV